MQYTPSDGETKMKNFNPKKTITYFADGTKCRNHELIEVDELGNHIMLNRITGKVLQYCDEVKKVMIQVKDTVTVHQERNCGTYGVYFDRKVTRTGQAYRNSNGGVSIEGDYQEDGGTVHMTYRIIEHSEYIAN